jgi:hypothetical protein
VAAVSFLDCWAYMLHNSNAEDLEGQPIAVRTNTCASSGSGCGPASSAGEDENERKYNFCKDVGMIAQNPHNQHWIQGPPPVFLNNEAPVPSRVLDALSCAVRTCCDTANAKFRCDMGPSVTAAAVVSHENELCSRNMVLSAHSLLKMQSETEQSGGQQLVISNIAAFFENPGEDEILTEGQLNTFLMVCNAVLQNPLILYHAGPTYHMVTNAAVLLAHFINSMTPTKDTLGEAELALYDEVYDTYSAIRRTLSLHRRKLPAKIRCHELPRVTVDLSKTILCSCRGCQGFVLQGCSPCVSAERANKAAEQLKQDQAAEEAEATNELGGLFPDNAFPNLDMDDDALLEMINVLIQQ